MLLAETLEEEGEASSTLSLPEEFDSGRKFSSSPPPPPPELDLFTEAAETHQTQKNSEKNGTN